MKTVENEKGRAESEISFNFENMIRTALCFTALAATILFTACKKNSPTSPVVGTRHCHVVKTSSMETMQKDSSGNSVVTNKSDTTVMPDEMVAISLLDASKISCRNATYTLTSSTGTVLTYWADFGHGGYNRLFYYPANDSLSITETVDYSYALGDSFYQDQQLNTFVNSLPTK